jgi:integrase
VDDLQTWGLEAARRRRPTKKTAKAIANREIVSAWDAYQYTRLADDTLRNYRVRINVFVDYVGGLPLTSVKRDDLWSYIEDYAAGPRGCTQFAARTFTSLVPVCRAGQDLAQCGPACPARAPIQPSTIEGHLNALASLFSYMQRHDLVGSNIAADVLEEWTEENRGGQRPRKYRRITVEEVERLLRMTVQPNRRAAFAIMPLTGTRIEEMQRLKVGPEWINLDQGWIEVPPRRKQKRRGETKLWLTEELVEILRWYLQWRDKRVPRDDDGNPLHDHLIITARGMPWTNYGTMLEAWHEQMERAGILTGDEDEFNTLTPHDMRHWMTTQLIDADAPDYFIALYRGDKRAVIADRYTHLTDEKKRKEFLRYAPRIKIF